MGKVVGIMQPTYFPWVGYFEMIQASDVFVLLDDVHFNKNSWQQRNCIKGPSGRIWLTVPVFKKGSRFQKINKVRINDQENWAKKHLKSLEAVYAKSPYFDRYIERFRELFHNEWEYLVDLTVASIRLLMEQIGITTPLQLSSAMEITQAGNEKVVEICKNVGANALYDTAGSVEFIDVEIFQEVDIQVIFQDYHHPEYQQLHGEFISHMSTVDLLFNEGPRSLDIICSGALNRRKGVNQ
jgi:hypothetical protein